MKELKHQISILEQDIAKVSNLIDAKELQLNTLSDKAEEALPDAALKLEEKIIILMKEVGSLRTVKT